MIKAYFFSDVHLGASESEEEKQKEQKLLDFLDKIKKDATHLFIVGDLFDFWFEYKYVIPKRFFNLLDVLKSITDQGIETHLLAGNHDFYLGTFFDKYLNIKTWQDEYTFILNGKRFYLWHGDGLGKKDVGYRILKRILRNKFNLRLFKLLHPDFGIPFARLVSGSSRKYTNQLNHLRDESDYIKFAEDRFDEGYDYVLMGHRHNPLLHQSGKKKYINLGDWIIYFTYAVFDGNELEFKKYEK